jgi:hypothetical protein
MTDINNSKSGYTGDRGLILYNWSATPFSPMNETAAAGTQTAKKAFIGVDASEGVFKYIEDGEINTIGTGSNTTTYINNGKLGPAKFREINNVGITSDNTNVILKTWNGTGSIPTNTLIQGHSQIIGPATSANKAYITLEDNARVKFANTIGSSSVVEFTRGITFGVQTNGNALYTINSEGSLTTGALNGFDIMFNNSSGAGKHIYFRNVNSASGPLSGLLPVDMGRVIPHTNLISATPGLASNDSNKPWFQGVLTTDYVEQPQQWLFNKTLSSGTIIDCGTY